MKRDSGGRYLKAESKRDAKPGKVKEAPPRDESAREQQVSGLGGYRRIERSAAKTYFRR